MAVAHFAVDLRLGGERRHGVHHHHVDGAAADERLHYVESLLAVVRLGYVQVLKLHAQSCGVRGIQRMLRVDERGSAARLLHFRYDVQRDGGLAGGFRTVYLDYPALGDAAYAERDIEGKTARGHRLDFLNLVVAQTHDRAFAELLLDLGKRQFQGISLRFLFFCHNLSPFAFAAARRPLRRTRIANYIIQCLTTGTH